MNGVTSSRNKKMSLDLNKNYMHFDLASPWGGLYRTARSRNETHHRWHTHATMKLNKMMMLIDSCACCVGRSVIGHLSRVSFCFIIYFCPSGFRLSFDWPLPCMTFSRSTNVDHWWPRLHCEIIHCKSDCSQFHTIAFPHPVVNAHYSTVLLVAGDRSVVHIWAWAWVLARVSTERRWVTDVTC